VQAKDRKREILRLREELKLLQDGARGEEMEPPVASCRCHFFDGCGDLPPPTDGDAGEHWVDDVLRRRFVRLVRWKDKRRRLDRSLPTSSLMGGYRCKHMFFSLTTRISDYCRIVFNCSNLSFNCSIVQNITLRMRYNSLACRLISWWSYQMACLPKEKLAPHLLHFLTRQ
jgi:hypothetical protein